MILVRVLVFVLGCLFVCFGVGLFCWVLWVWFLWVWCACGFLVLMGLVLGIVGCDVCVPAILV